MKDSQRVRRECSRLAHHGLLDYDPNNLRLRPAGSTLPPVEDFAYDRAGNREDPSDPSAYDYDPDNRMLASPGLTYTYDDDGNVTGRSDGASFGYDVRGRLRTFAKGGLSASYAYDPFGRRIRKTVAGQTTWFVWDGPRLLAEFDGGGGRTLRYDYAGGLVPVQVVEGSAVRDVHTDRLGRPRLLTDAAGEALWRAAYESFGWAHVDGDVDGNGQSVSFGLRLPGQYLDAESGLHYNGLRTYDPTTGRYLEADPAGQAAGVNLYPYARSNPIGFIDPDGALPILPRMPAPFVDGVPPFGFLPFQPTGPGDCLVFGCADPLDLGLPPSDEDPEEEPPPCEEPPEGDPAPTTLPSQGQQGQEYPYDFIGPLRPNDTRNPFATDDQVAGLDPVFKEKLGNVFDDLRGEGFQPRVASGLRTLEEQKRLVEMGRSLTLESKHLEGRAADVIDRRRGYRLGHEDPFFEALQNAAERQGLRSGRRFRTFPDPSHVELP